MTKMVTKIWPHGLHWLMIFVIFVCQKYFFQKGVSVRFCTVFWPREKCHFIVCMLRRVKKEFERLSQWETGLQYTKYYSNNYTLKLIGTPK